MGQYLALGLLVVAIAAIALVIQLRRPKPPRSHDSDGGDGFDRSPRVDRRDSVTGDDDTAPAVLSPPEWTPPKSGTNRH